MTALRQAPGPGQRSDHAQANRALARGSMALVANSAGTALFGVAFWLVAARVLSAVAVGRGLALVSALFTVSGLCQLNYGRSLSGLLPQAVTPRRLLAGVYALTACLSVVVGLGTAVALPHLSSGFSYLRGDGAFVVVFAAAVVLWTIFTLEDSALVSVRRTTVIPFENGLYGVLKLACLVGLRWAGYRSGLVLFLAWVVPLLVVVPPVNLYLFSRAMRGSPPLAGAVRPQAAGWLRYDFAGYLLWLSGTLPVPVIVLTLVSAARAAAFSVPFTIVASLDLLLLMLGNSLTAEISRARGVVTAAARAHIKRVLVISAVLSSLIFALASPALQVFGTEYRANGTLVLQIFMIANLPRTVLFLGIAVQRAKGNGKAILVLQAIPAIGTLALGLVLVRALGAVGMAAGWLTASGLAAVVAVVLAARSAVGDEN